MGKEILKYTPLGRRNFHLKLLRLLLFISLTISFPSVFLIWLLWSIILDCLFHWGGRLILKVTSGQSIIMTTLFICTCLLGGLSWCVQAFKLCVTIRHAIKLHPAYNIHCLMSHASCDKLLTFLDALKDKCLWLLNEWIYFNENNCHKNFNLIYFKLVFIF